ncbi:MAG: hypothetical protein J1F01_09015 [Oscillospiraceae bacterium]|nr:hypothetical protein [Oscillospiraceae bacterium]
MILLIAILYFGYKLAKEAAEDTQIRNQCRNRGFDTYPSSTGLRDMKTGKRCYVNPRTGEKTLF